MFCLNNAACMYVFPADMQWTKAKWKHKLKYVYCICMLYLGVSVVIITLWINLLHKRNIIHVSCLYPRPALHHTVSPPPPFFQLTLVCGDEVRHIHLRATAASCPNCDPPRTDASFTLPSKQPLLCLSTTLAETVAFFSLFLSSKVAHDGLEAR